MASSAPPLHVSDPPVLPRVAAGDQTAVSECIRRYGRLILALARRFLGPTGEAEDLVQDIFIELWKHAGRFNPSYGSELTFVTTVARRRLIDVRRRSNTRPSEVALPDWLPESRESGENEFDTVDDVAKARAALSELREEQRTAILMAVDLGLSHGEIASQMNVPLGTVKTHIRRGLQSVRQKLVGGAAGGQS